VTEWLLAAAGLKQFWGFPSQQDEIGYTVTLSHHVPGDGFLKICRSLIVKKFLTLMLLS
jgi:hypothetical protein